MAEKLKLEIEQRATFRHRLIWKGRNNKRIDLSGWTAIMQVRPSFSDDLVVIELSSANGRITLNYPIGVIDLYISDEDTSVLTPGMYEYDLLLSACDGSKLRLIEGKCHISGGVSHG